jgi:hypothetical protein
LMTNGAHGGSPSWSDREPKMVKCKLRAPHVLANAERSESAYKFEDRGRRVSVSNGPS